MAVAIKDVKEMPKDAPTQFLMEKHTQFISEYGKGDTYYEYVMAEFLRINGVYWSNTALHLMGASNALNAKEVRQWFGFLNRPAWSNISHISNLLRLQTLCKAANVPMEDMLLLQITTRTFSTP